MKKICSLVNTRSKQNLTKLLFHPNRLIQGYEQEVNWKTDRHDENANERVSWCLDQSDNDDCDTNDQECYWEEQVDLELKQVPVSDI